MERDVGKRPNRTEILQIKYRNGRTGYMVGIIPDGIITAFPIAGFLREKASRNKKPKK